MNLSFSRWLSGSSLRALLIVAALVLGMTIAWRPITVPDEGRYTSVAAAMWATGDWVVPKLNGLPFFHKPPLFYWITGALYGLTGETAWAGRGAAWVGAMLAVLGLAWLVRVAHGGNIMRSRWAVIALVTQPLWFMGAQFANLDMLVAGCIAASISVLAGHALAPEHRRARWVGFALLAAGVLAKGLIGVVLPMAVLVTWLVLDRRWRALLGLAWWPGWLLFAAITVPWFLAVEARHEGFLYYFIVVQHFQRFVTTGFNNAMPGWFYLVVLFAGTLPWALWSVRGLISQAWASLQALKQAPDPADADGALNRLALVWAVVITVFFSLPTSKLVGYILPVVPALALLLSGLAARRSAAQPESQPWGWPAVGLALSLSLVGLTVHLDTKGASNVADAIRPQLQVGDALVGYREYEFDLGLLLRKPAPIVVLHHWKDPETTKGDSWPKELFDGGAFDTAAGQRLLRPITDLPAVLCNAPRTWLYATPEFRSLLTQQLGVAPQVVKGRLPGLVQALKARGHLKNFQLPDTDVYLLSAPRECPAAAQQKG